MWLKNGIRQTHWLSRAVFFFVFGVLYVALIIPTVVTAQGDNPTPTTAPATDKKADLAKKAELEKERQELFDKIKKAKTDDEKRQIEEKISKINKEIAEIKGQAAAAQASEAADQDAARMAKRECDAKKARGEVDETCDDVSETEEQRNARLAELRKIKLIKVECRDSAHVIGGNLPCNDSPLPKKDPKKKDEKEDSFVEDDSTKADGEKLGSGIQLEIANALDCEKPEYIEKVNRKPGAYKDKQRPGFKSVVKCLVRDDLRRETELYYDGDAVDWFTSERLSKDKAIPVCNLGFTKDRDGYPSEVESNFKGETCGSMCEIKVNIFKMKVEDPQGCGREAAWFRGYWIHALNHHKEKVFGEFEAGSINITAMDGPKPCAQLAGDLIEFQKKNNTFVRQATRHIAKKFKPKPDTAFAELEAHASKEVCGRTDRFHELGSFSVCTLDTIQKQLLALWSYFLSCEIHVRALGHMNTELSSPNSGLGRVQNDVESCSGEVCSNPLKCSNSKASRQATSCYRRKILDPLLKYLNQNFPLTQPMEMPGKDMPATKPLPLKANETDKCALFEVSLPEEKLVGTASRLPGEKQLPFDPGHLFFFFGIVTFRRRFSFRRRSYRAALAGLAFLLGITVLIISSGCGKSRHRGMSSILPPLPPQPCSNNFDKAARLSADVRKNFKDLPEFFTSEDATEFISEKKDGSKGSGGAGGDGSPTLTSGDDETEVKGRALDDTAGPKFKTSGTSKTGSAATAISSDKDSKYELTGRLDKQAGTNSGANTGGAGEGSSGSEKENFSTLAALGDGSARSRGGGSLDVPDDRFKKEGADATGKAGIGQNAIGGSGSGEGNVTFEGATGADGAGGSSSGRSVGSTGMDEGGAEGGGSSDASELDAYLEKNSAQGISLFDVISRKYNAWGTGLKDE